MFHATEEVNLIRLASLRQNLLRLVAFGGGEDGVGLCRNVQSSSSKERIKDSNRKPTHPLQRWTEGP